MTLATTEKEKLNYLDSIRGIAALTVFIGHFDAAFYINSDTINISNIIHSLTKKFFLQGNFIVSVFFVLSGFVLSYNYFKSFDTQYLYKQSIKRFPRLFLPILLTSFLYWIAKYFDLYRNLEVVAITKSVWFSQFWLEAFTIKQLIFRCAYDLLLFNDQLFCNVINTSLWTMPIELKYSFLLFFTIFFMRKWQIILSINVFMISILIFYPNTISIYFLAFLLGSNLSFLYVNSQIKINKSITYILLLVSLLIPCFHLFNLDYAQDILAATLLLFVCLYNDNIKSLLNNKFLQYLGKISFSLYLIHSLILGTISSPIFLFVFKQTSAEVAYLVSLMISVPITLITSDVVYKIIEKPSIAIAEFIYIYGKNLFSNKEKITSKTKI